MQNGQNRVTFQGQIHGVRVGQPYGDSNLDKIIGHTEKRPGHLVTPNGAGFFFFFFFFSFFLWGEQSSPGLAPVFLTLQAATGVFAHFPRPREMNLQSGPFYTGCVMRCVTVQSHRALGGFVCGCSMLHTPYLPLYRDAPICPKIQSQKLGCVLLLGGSFLFQWNFTPENQKRKTKSWGASFSWV